MAKPPGIGNKYVEVTIDEEGKTTVEVHGCDSASTCRKATEDLENALGKVTNRKAKDVKQKVIARA